MVDPFSFRNTNQPQANMKNRWAIKRRARIKQNQEEPIMWFEDLMGFAEESPIQVRDKCFVKDGILKSHVNGKSFVCGELETLSLADLRERVLLKRLPPGKMSVREVVSNVQALHADEANAGALFQVASQFNLLEMVSPNSTPEQGVGRYEYDRTQGPACAIAGGAGTIYRNYFASVNGQVGQSVKNQIDCLSGMGAALGNSDGNLWEMENGYALASHRGLGKISSRLKASTEAELDELRQLLRIGIQWNTQVTLKNAEHQVSQAYCSALPVSYSGHAAGLWTPFAKLILEAAYEATICSAILNSARTGNNRLFLTFLGGGVFGNRSDWIVGAIRRSLELYKHTDLDVAIVSHGSSSRSGRKLVDQYLAV